MLVARSFQYSLPPPKDFKKKNSNDQTPKFERIPVAPGNNLTAKAPSTLTPAMLATPQPSKPVEIPSRRNSGESKNAHAQNSRGQGELRKSRVADKSHLSDALPPAVAALLAVTAIPRPRCQTRPKRNPVRQMSIDELVQEWRSDASIIKSSYSSASLDMLLETGDDDGYQLGDGHMYSSRSTSCDSIPSLEGDDGSLLSISNPATPGSVRSRKSSHASFRREKSLSTPEIEDCGPDHPLGLSSFDLDNEFITSSPNPKERRERKSRSFKSNLSSSLQAIKTRVSSSFSSLNLNLNVDDASFSDASLWQHPFLFPRFSPELRPTPFTSPPSISQRRYLNPPPTPVSFEEQQHHWQKALSSQTLGEDFAEAPMIQMQTYKRGAHVQSRRSRRNSSTGSDPRSEAGRAMGSQAPMPSRQREPRENSDFLRVVVLEMNMRRGGKLEDGTGGRARIWLPPRKPIISREMVFASDDEDDAELAGSSPAAKKVPRRWVGVSME